MTDGHNNGIVPGLIIGGLVRQSREAKQAEFRTIQAAFMQQGYDVTTAEQLTVAYFESQPKQTDLLEDFVSLGGWLLKALTFLFAGIVLWAVAYMFLDWVNVVGNAEEDNPWVPPDAVSSVDDGEYDRSDCAGIAVPRVLQQCELVPEWYFGEEASSDDFDCSTQAFVAQCEADPVAYYSAYYQQGCYLTLDVLQCLADPEAYRASIENQNS